MGVSTCENSLRCHFDVWQNQYNIVKLKNKIKKIKKKKKKDVHLDLCTFLYIIFQLNLSLPHPTI